MPNENTMDLGPFKDTEQMRVLNERMAAARELHRRARAAVREAHRAGGQGHRYAILAWTFLRGLSYRRAEAHHLAQDVGAGLVVVHHEPSSGELGKVLEAWGAPTSAEELRAWLREPARRCISRGPRLVVELRGDVPKAYDAEIVAALERGEAPHLPKGANYEVLGAAPVSAAAE